MLLAGVPGKDIVGIRGSMLLLHACCSAMCLIASRKNRTANATSIKCTTVVVDVWCMMNKYYGTKYNLSLLKQFLQIGNQYAEY